MLKTLGDAGRETVLAERGRAGDPKLGSLVSAHTSVCPVHSQMVAYLLQPDGTLLLYRHRKFVTIPQFFFPLPRLVFLSSPPPFNHWWLGGSVGAVF